MATKTPAERAIADVEKAIKDHQKAEEKYEALSAKLDELAAASNRAHRELMWKSLHPDLPEDFDLDEFRRSLEAPFEDETPVVEPEVEAKAEAVGDAVESGAIDPDALEEPVADIGAADEDDPWAAE